MTATKTYPDLICVLCEKNVTDKKIYYYRKKGEKKPQLYCDSCIQSVFDEDRKP